MNANEIAFYQSRQGDSLAARGGTVECGLQRGVLE
jgi:hypothetical protein